MVHRTASKPITNFDPRLPR